MPRIISVDTETFRFGEQPDGSIVIIPRMICTSWATREAEGIVPQLVSDGDGDRMRELWQGWLEGNDLLVLHNAAFDLGVCCVSFPELEPLVWAKLQRGEITCTKIREKLLNLSTHGQLDFVELPDGTSKTVGYTLADLVQRYEGVDLSDEKTGEESVRTQYDLYAGMPSVDYPHEARHYALQDAHWPLAVYEAQQNSVKSQAGYASLHTEHFQTCVDFALYLMTAQGMPIDAEEFERLRQEMAEILHENNLAPLIRAGILRPSEPERPHANQIRKARQIMEREGWPVPEDWGDLDPDYRAILEDEGVKFTKAKAASVNRKELCKRVERISREAGIEPKLTETGGICADAEVIADLVAFDHAASEPGDEDLPEDHPRRMSPLENYQYRQDVGKIISTEIPRMMWNDAPAERVHFNYSVLRSTGRTSSFASKHWPSANGQNIDPRARPSYLPEPGHWLLSTDYSAMELCGVAQTTYDLFGYSTHRDKINAGKDLHQNLGAFLAARLPSEFEGDTSDLDRNYDLFSQVKIDDPDSYKRWRGFAKPVGLGYPGGLGALTFMSLAKKTYKVNIMKAALEMPEEFLPGPDHKTVAWHAEQLGLDTKAWKWTPMMKGIALSVLLKDVWLEVYPEMVDYFDWVAKQHDPHNCHSDGSPKLCYTTPLGMHRAGGSYTAVANGCAMQAIGAEGAKIAVFRIMEAVRVGRLRGKAFFPNFVHDENILSVPADPAGAAEVIEVVEEIMVDSMQTVMPDVRISVESALMERWLKKAEPVRDRVTGLLVPWRPDVAYEKDENGQLWSA